MTIAKGHHQSSHADLATPVLVAAPTKRVTRLSGYVWAIAAITGSLLQPSRGRFRTP
jgi:hypothetical protein